MVVNRVVPVVDDGRWWIDLMVVAILIDYYPSQAVQLERAWGVLKRV